ncbi:MAG: Stringent starvation protein [Proteobacteria bacterium]|nr:Stringent starvation protein [Pseudomonadota bacterium]
MELPSTKPYLLRAIWEWCCDNGLTPHIAVTVDSRTRVPREFVRDGQIVLNVGPDATNKLQIGNELVEFQARFGGIARELSVPVGQITAIYARENGAGMSFELEDGAAPGAGNVSGLGAATVEPPDEPPEPPRPEAGRPKLQRIK